MHPPRRNAGECNMALRLCIETRRMRILPPGSGRARAAHTWCGACTRIVHCAAPEPTRDASINAGAEGTGHARQPRLVAAHESLTMSVGHGLRLNSAAKSVQERPAGTAFCTTPVADRQVRPMRIRKTGTAGRTPCATPPLPAVAGLRIPGQAFVKLTNSAAAPACTSTWDLETSSCHADAQRRGDAADRVICNFCIERGVETGKARGVLQSGVSRPQHGGIAPRADTAQPARKVMSPYQASAVSPVLSVSVETITPLTDAGSVPKARR
jgi:hypothetical protein